MAVHDQSQAAAVDLRHMLSQLQEVLERKLDGLYREAERGNALDGEYSLKP